MRLEVPPKHLQQFSKVLVLYPGMGISTWPLLAVGVLACFDIQMPNNWEDGWSDTGGDWLNR